MGRLEEERLEEEKQREESLVKEAVEKLEKEENDKLEAIKNQREEELQNISSSVAVNPFKEMEKKREEERKQRLARFSSSASNDSPTKTPDTQSSPVEEKPTPSKISKRS